MRPARLVEALYYEWLTRFLRVLQRIDLIRSTAEAKNEISKVCTWFRTLEVYIKPEEDALLAAKIKRRYDRLERAKNI